MSVFGKIGRGISRGASEARRALRVAAAAGRAFGGVVRGTVGKILGVAVDLDRRVGEVEKEIEKPRTDAPKKL